MKRAPPVKQSSWMYGYWAGSLLLLGILAAFCILVLKPHLEVRAAINGVKTGGWTAESLDQAVAKLGGPHTASQKLAFCAQFPDRLAPCKDSIMVLMDACGPEAIPDLAHLMKANSSRMRCMVALSLGATNDRRAVEPLVIALEDVDPTVRTTAIGALRMLGGSRAVDALIGALQKPDPLTRTHAARVLGGLRDRSAVAPLQKTLTDVETEVRLWSASSLGEIGDESAIPILESAATNDPNEKVRQEARYALGKLRVTKATKTNAPVGMCDGARELPPLKRPTDPEGER